MLEIALHHRFSGFELDVQTRLPGGVTALFGRSGSGKTSVVNAVAGLLRPHTGRIVLNGTTLLDTERNICVPPHKRQIGYVFQDARLFPHMSVARNLTYGQRFALRLAPSPVPSPVPDPLTVERVVQLLGLEQLLSRRPATLSGGEKQRVAIGRALLARPRLLLMDEPLAALDGARKGEILSYLERLHDETTLPILYVSHSVAEVARLATALVVLDDGKLRVSGPLETVLSDPGVAPSLGLREAGAVVTARLSAQDADGLTRLDTAAGPVWLPRTAGQLGDALRLRILAHDVMLARVRPSDISALNILPARVTALRQGDGPGVLVQIALGHETHADAPLLLARITQRSATALELAPGTPVFAILKAVSVARENVALGPEGAEPTGR